VSGPHLHVAERSACYQAIKNIESIGWPTVPLSKAVEINPKTDRSLLADNTEVTFVPMAAVEAASGRVDTSTVRRYEEVKKGYTHFRDGDVLFAKITPCMENGKMAVVQSLRNGIGLGSTEFHVLRPREGVDPHYVYYFVSSKRYRSEAAHHMTGAVGQKRVPVSFLEQSEIPLPSPTEQRRIVAEIEKQFSRLEEAVDGLQRVKANLKRYKAAVLKAAVEGRLVPIEADLARREGRNYETGTQLLQRILDTRRSQWQGKGKYKEPAAPDTTNLPELPEGWTWATYAQIGNVTTGFTPPTADTANFGGDVPFIKPTDLDAGDNVVTAREYLSAQGIAKGRKLPIDSVLVTCIGATIGKTGLARVECATNQQINAVSFAESSLVPDYVYSWTVSPAGQRQIVDNASATTLPILNKSKFEALAVAVPPLAEQRRIVDEVDRLLSIAREAEAAVETNLKRAQSLRQTILSQAFTTSQGMSQA
jgi:type I restriction enzyme S subunit